MLLSSAGSHDCSNHCQTPWPLQIPWVHHLLAAATAPTIVKHHGQFKHHCSIIWWRPQLLQQLPNAMTTSNTSAPSSVGGRDCFDHFQKPWSLQIPWLHHLLAAATALTIVECHGYFKYHGSIICWWPRLLWLLSDAMATKNTMAPSSAGGRYYSDHHCRMSCPLQIPCLQHLLVAATAPTIVERHG